MRAVVGLGASFLAGLAAVISSLDGDADLVPFFVLLTFLGGVVAGVAYPPLEGVRRAVARAVAVLWAVAAIWVGVLLFGFGGSGSSGPVPPPAATYAGLTATAYHLVGLYGGLVLVVLAAFAPKRWLGEGR